VGSVSAVVIGAAIGNAPELRRPVHDGVGFTLRNVDDENVL
jgi:hypothetical protein